MRAGETQSLSGAAPLSVFLGNAPGVKVEFEGKTFDTKKSTRDNNTARFTLPPAP
jgi:cytoskeleton protein RodZ